MYPVTMPVDGVDRFQKVGGALNWKMEIEANRAR